MGVPPKIGRLTIYWGELTGMMHVDFCVKLNYYIYFKVDKLFL